MLPAPVIVWFRKDLRLSDNPAFQAAVQTGQPVVAVFCLDDVTGRPIGGASRWWLHHSLHSLQQSLTGLGVTLVLLKGACGEQILRFVREIGASAIHWNRRYDLPGREADAALKLSLRDMGVEVTSHNGTLLVEPWTIKPASGASFKVFTPFWKQARARLDDLPAPVPALEVVTAAAITVESLSLADLGLLPTKPDWSAGLQASWHPGEAGARARLAAFLDEKLAYYADERDRPDLDRTSGLSPYLAFGEISITTVWTAARLHAARAGIAERVIEKFLAELGWREFSYHLLFHFPDLATRNFQPRFDAFPWNNDRHDLVTAWQKGMTGYPIVDAGMRQLWQTGSMHNRVRMIVASFLVKHLLIDWRVGEAWFWDTLVDADPASNAASWQWVAGSGADAAPYFRVFNPILQGQKFDPDGDYVRQYVPELREMPSAMIHTPWLADFERGRNRKGGIHRTYPEPIVDHAGARARALDAFAALKTKEEEELA